MNLLTHPNKRQIRHKLSSKSLLFEKNQQMSDEPELSTALQPREQAINHGAPFPSKCSPAPGQYFKTKFPELSSMSTCERGRPRT